MGVINIVRYLNEHKTG